MSKWYAIGRYGRSADVKGPFGSKSAARKKHPQPDYVYVPEGTSLREAGDIGKAKRAHQERSRAPKKSGGFIDWLEGLFS